MMKSFMKMLRMIGHHGEILFKGIVKTLYGVLMAAMIVAAVYGFTAVASEGGYAAVCDFLVSAGTMCIALGGIYLMGGHCKKGAAK